MPPRLQRVQVAPLRILSRPIVPRNRQICLFCSFSQTVRPLGASIRLSKRQLPTRIQARRQTTAGATISSTSTTPPIQNKGPRSELRDALADLGKHAASHVNISRLQLAIRGLDQTAGQETIRIAILGLADGGASLKKAKELARLLVADPLKAEEEWERILVNGEGRKPILLKLRQTDSEETVNASRLVQQLQVSSPMLNGHNLEILVLETDPSGVSPGSFVESLLVPTMEIPTSNTGRYIPVTTPVHRSFIVADGIMGAARILNYPNDLDRDTVGTAVDMQVGDQKSGSTLPFQTIDIARGTEALRSFRESVGNALVYEEDWFASNVPQILDWVKSGTTQVEGNTKEPLKKLVLSLLEESARSIQTEDSRQLSTYLASKPSSSELASLKQAIKSWALAAHTELRDDLDVAFNGSRWRKLGWWKLFWRVDDVSMISSDILAQRFLINVEKDLIFLYGRLDEAEVMKNAQSFQSEALAHELVQNSLPLPQSSQNASAALARDIFASHNSILPKAARLKPWPVHIPAARAYLSKQTVPRLQALAQKLVFQTLTTSSFASIFAGLLYVGGNIGSVTTGVYEVGAVAALGIVWSMKRMQRKWETAREYWEGEVREEGRKAVRGVEGVIGEYLANEQPMEVDEDLRKAKEALERAEYALKACK